MAGSSVNVSGSSGTSSSTPASVNSPQTDWSLQLSQLLTNLGQYQYNWAQNQFAKTSAITDAQINNYINTAQQGTNLAANTLGRYENTYAPLADENARYASQYASEGRVRHNMGRAEAGQTQAGDQARINAEQQLQSFGIDPSSGRYADLEMANQTKTAAAAAAAGEAARINTEATGRQLKQNAIAVGQQLPGATVNALNSAYQGISGAENSALGNANTGVNLTDSAAPYLNAASGAIKVPPVGNTSTAQNQSRGAGSSVQTDAPQRQQQQQGPNSGHNTGQTSGSGANSGANKPGSGPAFKSAADTPQGGGDTGPGGVLGGEPTATGNNDTGNVFDPSTGQWGDQGGVIPNDVPGNPVSDVSDTGGDVTGSIPGQGNYGIAPSDPGNYGSNDVAGQGNYGIPESSGNYGGSYSGGYGGGYSGGYGGGYKKGGVVRGNRGVLPTMAGGGQVPQSMSPSNGKVTDDVPAVIPQTGGKAQLNAREFVIPQDVTDWKGQEYFQKLIQTSRKARLGATAKPTYSQGAPNAA